VVPVEDLCGTLLEGRQFLAANANLTAEATKFVAHVFQSIRFADAALNNVSKKPRSMASV